MIDPTEEATTMTTETTTETMPRDWLHRLRAGFELAGQRACVALTQDAEAGSVDALASCAKLAGPSVEAAQARERLTSRYACLRCGETSWNQICLTCDPSQHPSLLDAMAG